MRALFVNLVLFIGYSCVKVSGVAAAEPNIPTLHLHLLPYRDVSVEADLTLQV